MRNETVASFLQALAGRVPAPGGGATAAEGARAAATTARVNIEINLGGIPDAAAREELRDDARAVDALAERADKVTAAVRAELGR